jgi:hypothetical protein
MRERRGVCMILVGKPEGQRPLGRPQHRWDDNIQMDLWDEGWGISWNDVAEVSDCWWSLVSAAMKLQVP